MTDIEELNTEARAKKALRTERARPDPLESLYFLFGFVCSEVDRLRKDNEELRQRLDRVTGDDK